jgi:phosphate transport system protein
MTKHFLRELENLKRDVTAMGGMAETAVADATRAFLEQNTELARSVIEADDEINALEVRIEEECLKLLALYQPTAKDLRYLVSAFKIINDLERVGDLAVNLAERALDRSGEQTRPGIPELTSMSGHCREMLRRSLDAFLTLDSDRAREVMEMDDEADESLRELYESQVRALDQGETRFESAMRILASAKYLERIADLSTNIAEDVFYVATGEVIRHQE